MTAQFHLFKMGPFPLHTYDWAPVVLSPPFRTFGFRIGVSSELPFGPRYGDPWMCCVVNSAVSDQFSWPRREPFVGSVTCHLLIAVLPDTTWTLQKMVCHWPVLAQRVLRYVGRRFHRMMISNGMFEAVTMVGNGQKSSEIYCARMRRVPLLSRADADTAKTAGTCMVFCGNKVYR